MFTNDCQKCGKEFLVTDEDLELFTTQNVPLPVLCEDCRAGGNETETNEEPKEAETVEEPAAEESTGTFFQVVDDEPVAEETEAPVLDVTEPEVTYTPAYVTEEVAVEEAPVTPVVEVAEEVVEEVATTEVAEETTTEVLADTENTIEAVEEPENKKKSKFKIEKKPLTKKDKIIVLACGIVLILAAIGLALWGTVGGGFGGKETTTEPIITEANADVTEDTATEEATEETTETTTEETTEPEVTHHEKTTIPDNVYVGEGFTIVYNK